MIIVLKEFVPLSDVRLLLEEPSPFVTMYLLLPVGAIDIKPLTLSLLHRPIYSALLLESSPIMFVLVSLWSWNKVFDRNVLIVHTSLLEVAPILPKALLPLLKE